MQEVTDSSSVVPTTEPYMSCRRFRPNAPMCGVSLFFSDLHIFPCKSLKKWARRPFRRRAHFFAFSLTSLFGIAQRMRSDRRKIMYPSLLALILVWTKAFGENGFMAHRYNPCASRKTYQNYFCGSINATRSCTSSEAVKLCLGTA